MDNGSLFDSGSAPEGAISGQLQPYEFPFTGQQVRAGLIDDEPWFVAPDVCMILKHTNVTMAVKGLDEDERRTIHRSSSEALNFPDLFADQRIQSATLINESGLYSLVLRSKVPAAREFRKWVNAVIKQIRRTGSYSLVPQQFDPTDLDHVAQLAQIAADQKRQIQARDEKIAELEPKAQHAEQHRAADGLKSVGDFANDVKAWAKRTHGVVVKHKQVWDHLARLKLIIRGNTVRHNHPTAFAVENDYVRAKETTFERTRGFEETSVSPRLTPAGEGYAWDRITRYIAEHGTLDLV